MKNADKFKTNIKIMLGVYITLFTGLIIFLVYSIFTYGESWYATTYNPRIKQNLSSIDMGIVMDVTGKELAWSVDDEREYADDKNLRLSVGHVLGDVSGMTIGAQTRFAKYLYGKAQTMTDRVEAVIQGSKSKGSDVVLSVNSNLCKYAYSLLKERNGAVVVMDYKTGKILISTSYPSFDVFSVADDELIDTALIDRVTMGRYPPGSTMKIVTASAALNAGIDMEYTCTGETVINGVVIRCASGTAHGKENLKKAFASSCNTYFAELSTKIGAETLLKYAESFGFNTEYDFSEVTLYKSNFELSGEANDLAWAGVGQYKDLVTPLHIAMISSAIANGGKMMEPRLIDCISTNGIIHNVGTNHVFKVAVTEDIADKVKEFMREAVISGTCTSASVKGVSVCGKTGTAEYYEDGEVKNHSWFTGFIEEDEYPYAIAVIVEGAGYGSKYAAPIAGKIFDKIVNG